MARIEGEEAEIANWTRPTLELGNPPDKPFQVAPPSMDLYTPFAFTRGSQDERKQPTAANRTEWLDGFCITSVTEAANSWLQVPPLLTDLYSPKLVAAKRVELLAEPAVAGSTTILLMYAPPVGVSKTAPPSWVHVTPPSVDRSTPQP